MEHLEPCPVCGKLPKLSTLEPDYHSNKYFCATHVSIGDWKPTETEAALDWNRRTKDTTQPELYIAPKPTNADRFRRMNDEELAELLYSFEDLNMPDYCQRKKECDDMLDADIDIPAENCKRCLVEYLRQPAEEG